MSKEAEMMKELDELLKTKIGCAEDETDEFGFKKYGIHHAYPTHIFRYMDTDILSIRDKNNYKFQKYIKKLINSYMKEKKKCPHPLMNPSASSGSNSSGSPTGPTHVS